MCVVHALGEGRDLVIRPARGGDAEAMAALTHAIAKAEGHPEACRVSAADMARIVLEEGRARCLVADAGAERGIVGMVLYYPSFPSYSGKRGFFIENLVVAEDARGGGVARQLMDGLRMEAEREGVGCIEWVCDRDNAVARRFYEDAMGAIPQERYMLYGLDVSAQAGR